jgi:hypothetical protein
MTLTFLLSSFVFSTLHTSLPTIIKIDSFVKMPFPLHEAVKSGNAILVESMIQDRSVDVNQENEQG